MEDKTQTKNFILVDKPVDWTSFDVVNFLRSKLRVQTGNKKIKVGHCGTLDPFATGLLIVAVGRENTKRIDEFKNLPKTYIAKIRLGAVSDTQDPTGTISQVAEESKLKTIDLEKIVQVTKQFTGEQLQIPPMYSAKKIDGHRLYDLARKGKEVERKPNNINIFAIKVLNFNNPDIEMEITCSAGTYIRTLAHDIGQALDVGAYCLELRRTKIGDYDVAEAQKIEK